jgi:NADH dehydrogenase [ubiquinone] 1 alpha subcomplex assembly factor 1
MSLTRSLTLALSRSIYQAKHSLASALRFDVVAPTTDKHDRVPIYTLASVEQVQAMATGCDADIGGLSSCKVDLDPQEGKGRFWGTLSSEIPRSSKLERSGYAGFRNKNRPTLFGAQTWDSTMHPYICLRVRNRLAKAISQQQKPSSLRSALSSFSPDAIVSPHKKAVHALGLDLALKPGPKFFVNVQTDGPVTSDLFQHRLTLDESKGDSWQNVIVSFSPFTLESAQMY